MLKYKILWADDEIDLLKPHILFLEAKGYDITSVNSGADALEKIDKDKEIIFIPDMNLGQHAAQQTNRKLILWEGYCHVHV